MMKQGPGEKSSKSDTLVVHQGALGDLMITLSALNRVFPRDRVDLFCRKRFTSLVSHLNAAAKAFNVESAGFAGLYAEKPDEKFRSWFAPYRRILLFSNSSVLTRNITALAACPVYGLLPRPPPENRVHVAEYLAAQLAGALPDRQTDKSDGPQMFKRKNRFCGKVLLHPGSGSPRKNWPLENFICLYRNFRADRIDAQWIIGPADTFLAQQLLLKGISQKDICINTDLVDFCRRIPPYTGFIGNDSGLTHLAAYLGVPVIAVFGPSDPIRWRPIGADVAVVSPLFNCPPCFEFQPSNCDDCTCLKSISPDRIIAEISG